MSWRQGTNLLARREDNLVSYSMSPYAISLAPRNERAGERRPIDDIDGEGLGLRVVIEEVLSDLSGDQLHLDTDDSSRALRLRDSHYGAGFAFAELGVGRAGLRGVLHRHADEPVPYEPDDHNEASVRSLFAFPSGGYEVFWLNERAGNTSARSDLGKRLIARLRERAGGMTPRIQPVVTWSAIEAWAEQVPVKELRFDAPRDGDSHAMQADGSHGQVRILVKPRADFRLKRLIRDGGGPNTGAVFGFLTEIPGFARESHADQLVHDGWKASVAFETPSGHQRSFTIGLGETAPSLIYQVGPDQRNLRQPVQPSGLEFAEACAEFLQDASEMSSGAPSVGDEILHSFRANG